MRCLSIGRKSLDAWKRIGIKNAHTYPAHRHRASARASTAVASYRIPACGRTRAWPVLKLERHDVAPASKSLPTGAEQHLVFVSLGRGHVDLERGGESIRRELTLGSVAVYPAGLPIRWSWRTPLSYSVLALDPAYLNHVACRIYGADPGDFELLPAERNHDFGIATLLGTLAREAGRRQSGPQPCTSSPWPTSWLCICCVTTADGRAAGRTAARRALEIEPGPGVPEPVQRAVRYIHEHHAHAIGLRDIAAGSQPQSLSSRAPVQTEHGHAPAQVSDSGARAKRSFPAFHRRREALAGRGGGRCRFQRPEPSDTSLQARARRDPWAIDPSDDRSAPVSNPAPARYARSGPREGSSQVTPDRPSSEEEARTCGW